MEHRTLGPGPRVSESAGLGEVEVLQVPDDANALVTGRTTLPLPRQVPCITDSNSEFVMEGKDLYVLFHRPFSVGCIPYIIQNDFREKIITVIKWCWFLG